MLVVTRGVALGLVVSVLLTTSCTATKPERVTPSPAVPATRSTPEASTAPVLSHQDVAHRCGPQIRSHQGEHGYRGIMHLRLGVAFDRDYHVGDIVRLVDTRPLPTDIMGPPKFLLLLCRIPAAGHSSDPVPESAFFPAPRGTADLATLCTEVYSFPWPRHDTELPGPDLTSARLVARSRAHGVLVALFTLDRRRYGCSVPPSDAGIPQSNQDTPQTWYTTRFLPTAVPRPNPSKGFVRVYSTWGKVPPGAATLDFIRTNGTRASSPVTEDGYYAVSVADSAPKLSTAVRYEFVAADGKVLGSGPALRE